MTSLTERLSQAEVGSRELSDEVLLACGWERKNAVLGPAKFLHWRSPRGEDWGTLRPSPTESVDDALTLVPEGPDWRYLLDRRAGAGFRHDGYRAHVWNGITPSYEETESWAATPALAICIAILRALQEKSDG